VLKAEVMRADDNPRFVVTSLAAPTPQMLYEDLYCARGNCETCQSCNLRRTLLWPKCDAMSLVQARSALDNDETGRRTAAGRSPRPGPPTSLTRIPA
jgi:hypothetical protein